MGLEFGDDVEREFGRGIGHAVDHLAIQVGRPGCEDDFDQISMRRHGGGPGGCLLLPPHFERLHGECRGHGIYMRYDLAVAAAEKEAAVHALIPTHGLEFRERLRFFRRGWLIDRAYAGTIDSRTQKLGVNIRTREEGAV